MSASPTGKTVRPRLSIIGVFYNMAREAPRTLYSLSAGYQRGVSEGDYEVIAVDNGSNPPLDRAVSESLGGNFRHIRIDDGPPSPAAAINRGVAASLSPTVGILIDGARMSTPGVVQMALACLDRFDRPVVGTVGFHLGPDIQTRSPAQGYCQAEEDALLERSGWRRNGYRLFDISALGGSSRGAWLGRLAESNLLFLPRAMFDELEGYDERFDLPGGGLVNLDFYRRASDLKGSTLITLLGEATFHQIHGGTMANRPAAQIPDEMARYREQYRRIRGEDFRQSSRLPLLVGYPRREAMPWIRRASATLLNDWEYEAARSKAGGQASQPVSAPPSPELKPGDENYRAYVGRVEHYDLISALQFSLLGLLGLRESHYLLDVGCGSLRGGRLFIPYLQPSRYFGIEPNRWLVEEGINQEIGRDLVALKRPQFAYNDDFDLGVFHTDFDFILAQSIFSHTGPPLLRQCLRSAGRVLKQDGLLVATFVEREEDLIVGDEWVYPGLNHFSWSTIVAACSEAGLCCRKLDWPHTLQTWFVAAKDVQRIEAIAALGVDTVPDEVILTGHRFAMRKAGRPPNFYRNQRRGK
ncbi:Methyltransferase type 12 [Nitrosococcus halophilus Nc 4]|uniref:Methyltransferase type 12 n=1 Tax=Nitrosococcus halophilus (strain Nc4) TaxID=472759 RepID=D5C2L8_NITHN|nr:methyltransferase [Nitrosococcus halophilus]ADE16693.1 Methyltransferase type 12 [Nitrosococcus halophilus Nc 4]